MRSTALELSLMEAANRPAAHPLFQLASSPSHAPSPDPSTFAASATCAACRSSFSARSHLQRGCSSRQGEQAS